jgi:hypothetical protein
MPLNPHRAFNALLEGPLRLNDDGMWALYEGDEELSYWDEGQEMELQRGDTWQKGVVTWLEDGYGLTFADGEVLPLEPGMVARRRVGGSI